MPSPEAPVRLTLFRDPFDPNSGVEEFVDWRGPGPKLYLPEKPGRWILSHNGAPLGPLDELDEGASISPGDSLEAALVPTGTGLEASVIPGLGSSISGFFGAIGNGLSGLFETAKAVISTRYVFESLFVPNLPGRGLGRDTGTVYSWSGIGATYDAAGRPVPRCYGTHRVGFTVIAQDVRVLAGKDGPESYLYVLGLLSAGPILSIGQHTEHADDLEGDDLPETLQINGNEASNFDGVTGYVRMGDFGQTTVPGFDTLPTIYPVGLDVVQGNGTAQDPVLTDWSNATSWTMPQGAVGDRARVTIVFPAGLGQSQDDGDFVKKKVLLQIGLTQVDPDTGVAISDRAVFPSETESFIVNEKIAASFPAQFEIPFIDPDAYVAPAVGLATNFGSSGDTWGTLPQSQIDVTGEPGFTTTQDTPEEFSIFGVAQIANHEAFQPLVSWGDWDESTSAPKVEGFAAFVRERADVPGESELVLWSGDDIVTASADEVFGGSIESGEPFSWGIAYRRVDPGTLQPRADLYVNGTRVATATLAQEIGIVNGDGGAGPVIATLFANSAGVAARSFHGVIDETTFFVAHKSEAQMGALHNGGAWKTLSTSDPEQAGVLWGCRFGTQLNLGGGNSLVVIYGKAYDAQTVTGFFSFLLGLPSLVTGYVLEGGSESSVRGRFKFEVQRTNEEKKGALTIDDVRFSDVIVELDETVAYVGSALLGLRIKASEQLDSSRPNLTQIVSGRLVPVWTGESTSAPAFVPAFSRAAAWIAFDLITSKVGGLGQFFEIADTRLQDFADAAEWQEAKVYDMLGKRAIQHVEIDTTSAPYSAILRLSAPLPSHWKVGVEVELRLYPAAWPVASGPATILGLEEIDSETTDVRVSWPNGDPRNMVAAPESMGSLGSGWAWVGTTGTIVEQSVSNPLPISRPPAPALDLIEFAGVSQSAIRDVLDESGHEIIEGEVYQVSVDLARDDGEDAAPFGVQIGDGGGYAVFDVPGDGKVRRYTAFIPALGTNFQAVRFGHTQQVNASTAQQFYVGEVFVAPAESEPLPHDERPTSTSTTAPQNLIASPSALWNEDDWTRDPDDVALPIALEAVGVQPLPIGTNPGTLDGFHFESNGDALEQTIDGGVLDGVSYYLSIFAAPRDARGAVRLRLRLSGVDGGILRTVDQEEPTLLDHVFTTAPADDDVRIEIVQGPGSRRVSLGGAFLKQGSAPAGYDDGVSLGEVFATEPRIPTDIVFADRGFSAWDAVLTVLSAGRCFPYRVGGQIGLRVSRPGPSTALFGPWNIEAGSFVRECANPGDRVNSIIGEIQDEALDYARDPVQRDSDELEPGDATSTFALRRKVVDMRGVTRRSVATRELDYQLRALALGCEVVSFDTTTEGLPVLPGSIFSLVFPSASWGVGAKVYDQADDERTFRSDVEVVLETENLLLQSRDMGSPEWQQAGASEADEPVVDEVTGTIAPPSGLPAETRVFSITFPGTGNTSRLEQSFANRGGEDGESYVLSAWARASTGSFATVRFDFATPSTGIAGTNPTLSTTWQRVVDGPHEIAEAFDTDPLHYARIVQETSDLTARTIYVCAVRARVGDSDDGRDAVGLEATGNVPPTYVAVRRASDMALHFAPTAFKSGRVRKGGIVRLTNALPFVPQAGDSWAMGPLSELKRFVCLEATLRSTTMKSITGATYDEDVFVDPASYAAIELPTIEGQTLNQPASESLLPQNPSFVSAKELNTTDPDSATSGRSVQVSWSLDSATLQRVDRINVWARNVAEGEDGGLGRFERVAEAERGTSVADFSTSRFSLRRGRKLEIVVQPVTRAGLRRPLGKCPRVFLSLEGYFPVPPKPAGARVILAGTQAVYQIDEPSGGAIGSAVDIVRGGVFIHSTVGRAPAGSRSYGPTDDWVQVPDSADGRGNPRLLVRSAGPNSARGSFVEVEDALDLEGWPAVLDEGSWEDGPWSTDGSLDAELEEVDPDPAVLGSYKVLQFKSSSTAAQGVWTGDAIDLGRPRRVHLSAALIGEQIHPLIFDEFPPFDFPRGARWTYEGPLDRSDPLYGECSATLEVAYSSSLADPGSSDADFRAFRPGVFYARSIRFRIVIARPDDTWQVLVSRGAFAVRPLPPADADDIDGGEYL